MFFDAYIKRLNIRYCMGIGLADADNCQRAVIALDRIESGCFSKEEEIFVRRVRPLLEHLYANLLLTPPDSFSTIPVIGRRYDLTEREKQVAMLLCGGATPAAISEKYSISVSTVYRHIANLYKKLGVSNRQELFALFSTVNGI